MQMIQSRHSKLRQRGVNQTDVMDDLGCERKRDRIQLHTYSTANWTEVTETAEFHH